MKCPNCGEIENTEIIATIATKRPTQEIAYFCGKCGTRLAEEVQLTPIQDVLRQLQRNAGARTKLFVQDVIGYRFDTVNPTEFLFEWTEQGIRERISQ